MVDREHLDGAEPGGRGVLVESRRAQHGAGGRRPLFAAPDRQAVQHARRVEESLHRVGVAGRQGVGGALVDDEHRALVAGQPPHRAERLHRMGHVVQRLEAAHQVVVAVGIGGVGGGERHPVGDARRLGVGAGVAHRRLVAVVAVDDGVGERPGDGDRRPPAPAADVGDAGRAGLQAGDHVGHRRQPLRREEVGELRTVARLLGPPDLLAVAGERDAGPLAVGVDERRDEARPGDGEGGQRGDAGQAVGVDEAHLVLDGQREHAGVGVALAPVVVDGDDAGRRLLLEPFAPVPGVDAGPRRQLRRRGRPVVGERLVQAEAHAELDGGQFERADRGHEHALGEGADGRLVDRWRVDGRCWVSGDGHAVPPGDATGSVSPTPPDPDWRRQIATTVPSWTSFHRRAGIPLARPSRLRSPRRPVGRAGCCCSSATPGSARRRWPARPSRWRARDHITTRWAACSAGGATVAHSPWVTLLNGLGPEGRDAARSLAGSGPDPGAAATTAARASAYATVLDAVEQATTERPALLVLDDLHWADEGTLHLLDVVAAHVPAWPVLVVGAYRDTDIAAGSPLTRLGGRAERVILSGLDRRDVGTLLTRHLGPARGADLADRVVALTAGNPFLIGQIAQLLAEDRGARDLASFPAGARDLMEQRLSALDGDDRRLLVAAAVLGSPFRAVDLAALAGCDVITVTAGLERAASRRAVERAVGTGMWSFVHELFRYAALADAAAAEVADLHRAAAALLEGHDAEPAIVAAHLLAAGDVGEDAARWSTRAGDRALGAMAWEEAAGHYERALSVGSPTVDTRGDALAGLGRSLLLAGDKAGAGRAFAALADLGRSSGSAELLARAALGFSADLAGFEVRLFEQRQIDLLEEAARALADTPMLAWRADVLARLSVALSLTAPSTRRLELAEEAVALARASEDRLALARCLAAHCDAIAGPTHVAERDAEASEIIAIAESAADGPLELLGRRLRFVARLERGDVDGVQAEVGAYARRAEAVGNPLYSWYVSLWRGQAALTVGDVDTAERLADEAEMLGRAAGSTNGPVLASVLRLVALWQRGEYARAVERLAALGRHRPRAPHVHLRAREHRLRPRAGRGHGRGQGPARPHQRGRLGGDGRGRRVDGGTWSTSCAPPLPSTTRSCRRRWG